MTFTSPGIPLFCRSADPRWLFEPSGPAKGGETVNKLLKVYASWRPPLLSWLRRVADADELVTVGQLWFAAAVVIVIVIAAAAGLGFSWRVMQWAS